MTDDPLPIECYYKDKKMATINIPKNNIIVVKNNKSAAKVI